MDSLPVYNAGFEEDKYPKDQKKDMYFSKMFEFTTFLLFNYVENVKYI